MNDDNPTFAQALDPEIVRLPVGTDDYHEAACGVIRQVDFTQERHVHQWGPLFDGWRYCTCGERRSMFE